MTNEDTYIGFLVAGFFIGIFLLVGVDISPDSLIIDVSDIFFKTLPKNQITDIWNILKPFLVIIGIIEILVSIKLAIEKGISCLISSFLGFIGGLLFFFYPIFSIIIIICGGVFSRKE